jgi:hypothetical protein
MWRSGGVYTAFARFVNRDAKSLAVIAGWFILSLCSYNPLFAQSKDSANPTTAVDTAVYNRMRRAMQNRKLTRRIFSLLTVRPHIDTDVSSETSIDEQFAPYEGKTVIDIRIIVLPPFGYKVKNDTVAGKIKTLEKIGNATHSNTRNWVVRKNLLFRKGDKINPLLIAESESFLRRLEYFNDVFISIDSLPDERANITVVVKDNWSIGGYPHSISPKNADVEIYDRNFMGQGNNLALRGLYSFKYKKSGFGIETGYSNFMKTFININALYLDELNLRTGSFSVERPLQKNLNLFGQISFRVTKIKLDNMAWDSISPTYTREFSMSAGYAFNPFGNNNTFVVSTRFQQRAPLYLGVAQPVNADNYQYVKNTMWLAQFSLFGQRFFRDRLVNSFGKEEDFAYGYNLSLQGGYSEWKRFNMKGLYASVRAAANRRTKLGTVYVEGVLSSFFNDDGPFEGILNLKTDMFSPLFSIGNQKYRQFLSINYIKRLNYIPGFRNYYFTLNDLTSINLRTDSPAIERMIVKMEGDLFSSLMVAGFRFLFYSFVDVGWLAGRDSRLFDRANRFWGAGFGVRVRNELLVFRTLELKFGYYPQLHQKGFNNFVNTRMSIPNMSPNFTPRYPEEAVVDYR